MRGRSAVQRVLAVCGFWAAAYGSLITNVAVAAPPSAATALTPKKLRLGIDLEALGVGYTIPAGGGGRGLALFGAGLGRALLVDRALSVGGGYFARAGETPLVGLHLGGVILDGSAVVGARLALSIGGVRGGVPIGEGPAFDYTLVTGELIPYFRWMFRQGRARPYVDLHAGLGGGGVWGRRPEARGLDARRPRALVEPTTLRPLDHSIEATEERTLAPVVGAGAGVMYFLTPSVSIDIGGNLDYARSYDRFNSGFGDVDWRPRADNVVLNMTTGISLWL